MKDMQDGNQRNLVAKLQAVIAYKDEELRIFREKYKEATGKDRPELNDDDRRRLANKSYGLEDCLDSTDNLVWTVQTVLAWRKTLIEEKYNSAGPNQKKRGPKTISDELLNLILKISKENTNWGYKRIASNLCYLGHEVSFMTVKRVLNAHGIYPPEDGRSTSDFNQFYDSHRDIIVATDACTYELLDPKGTLKREHIFFFENIFTREVWLGGIAHNPNGKWMEQMAREQTALGTGKLNGMAYLVHDRDPLFTKKFTGIIASAGVKTKLSPPNTPSYNGYMESFIKTFKTECLDHLILTNEKQLQYVVQEFLAYYNKERPHSGLGGKMIDPWSQDPDGEIKRFTRLGGLLTTYRRVKNAA